MELQIFIYLMTPVIVRLSNENCSYINLQALEIKIMLLIGTVTVINRAIAGLCLCLL